MSAMYFLPKPDITTQELAIIMGFVTIGLIENIEQRKEEIIKGKKESLCSIRVADRSLNRNKTIVVSEGIYASMPLKLKRHFSSF